MLDCTYARCVDARLSYLVLILLSLRSDPRTEEFLDAGSKPSVRFIIIVGLPGLFLAGSFLGMGVNGSAAAGIHHQRCTLLSTVSVNTL